MSSLESWAIDKLSVFLGFDPETLQMQILPYLMTSETPEAFAEQLMGMVGTSDDALNFIHEFTERRFHPKISLSTPPPPPPSKPTVREAATTSSSKQPKTDPESAFPSLPSNQQPYETMWPANISVHQKKDDEYFAGLRKSKRSKNKSQNNTTELRAAAFPSDTKPAPKKEKKPKVGKEMTLEAALKELDIQAEKPGKKRKVCQCQATKHPLLTVAPNCLSCGKIICTAEGVGPCTFCGEPVLSKDQQIALIAEAKKKRSNQKQAQNQTKKTASTPHSGGMPAYASKLGGSGNPFASSPYQSDEDESNRLKAEKHKDKLLEFQRTSAKRSTVIDEAADFEVPTDQSNPWLTPQEKALLIKKQQSNLRRIERQGGSSRHKVMTLDIRTKQVKVEDASPPTSEDEDDHATTQTVPRAPSGDQSSAGTYSHNPLLKGITAPKFVGKSSKKIKGQMRRKERVQYDLDDIMNDLAYSASVRDDDIMDPVNEPVTCQ